MIQREIVGESFVANLALRVRPYLSDLPAWHEVGEQAHTAIAKASKESLLPFSHFVRLWSVIITSRQLWHSHV